MNTTELVVEMRPEKNSGPNGISTTSLVVFVAARISYITLTSDQTRGKLKYIWFIQLTCRFGIFLVCKQLLVDQLKSSLG